MIERLLAALTELGLEPSAEDVQDALWLALTAGDFDVPTWTRTTHRVGPVSEEPGQPPPEPGPGPPATDTSPPDEPPASITVHTERPGRGEPQAPPTTVRVAGASPLPGTLDIARAVRPFRRRVPSRFLQLVDEEATSDRTARDDLWIPVMRPTPARWLELALIVDGSPSMAIWEPTVRELQRLLEREGAFRDVRAWTLSSPARPTGRVRLRSRTRRGTGTGPVRDPEGLVDPTGTRLILVLTDGVSRAWREEPLRATMARWSGAGPVAIVQLLPERLWSRVALRTEPAWVRAPRPGAPSAKLLTRHGVATVKRTPAVPMVELTPEWLKSWSALVAGAADTWVPGAVSYFDKLDEDEDEDRPVGRPDSARQLVERFRATASPTAYQLAGYLAAAHLTVPVMHLVRRVMLPTTSGLDHLAEVFLSGLIVQQPLRRIDGRPAEVEYDFLPEVRDLLLNGVLRSEASLVLEKVGAYIEQHDPDTHGFTATLGDKSGTTRPDISEWSRPFATVNATVLRRLRRADTAVAFEDGGAPIRDPAVVAAPPPPVPEGAVRVGLLGATGSGKTTFLAALGVATMQQRSREAWTLRGGDPTSTKFLSDSIVQLREQRQFPAAGMEGITRLSWRFVPVLGGAPVTGLRRRGDDRAEFTVELLDLPGTYYLVRRPSEHMPTIIDHLASSKGLVYLFDPVRELQSGNSFGYFGDVMDLVVQHRRARDPSPATRLPHHLAVCVTKFDDPRIFKLAREHGWVSWSRLGTGPPSIPGDQAEPFFQWICRQRPDGSGSAVSNLIGRYFHADRVAYFVSSSIGFYASRGGRVDPEDYSNVDDSGGRPRIRGEVRPINVLEPFSWLERSIRAAQAR